MIIIFLIPLFFFFLLSFFHIISVYFTYFLPIGIGVYPELEKEIKAKHMDVCTSLNKLYYQVTLCLNMKNWLGFFSYISFFLSFSFLLNCGNWNNADVEIINTVVKWGSVSFWFGLNIRLAIYPSGKQIWTAGHGKYTSFLLFLFVVYF